MRTFLRQSLIVLWVLLGASPARADGPAQGAPPTPGDVLARVRLLRAEVDLLRREMGVAPTTRSPVVASSVAPRENHALALALVHRVARLVEERCSDPLPPPPAAPSPDRLAPADVLAVLDVALRGVRQVKTALGVSEEPAPSADAPEATPTDVFPEIVQAGREVEALLERRTTPTDVTVALDGALSRARGLLARFPDAPQPDPPPFERAKRPGEVFARLEAAIPDLRALLATAGATMAEVDWRAERDRGLPGDVLDLATHVDAGLRLLAARLPPGADVAPSPPPSGRMLPAHSFQRAAHLGAVLQALRARAEADPHRLDAPPPEVTAAREAFAAWQALEAEMRAAQAEMSRRIQAAASEEEKKALRDELWAGIRERGKRAERAAEAFRQAFEPVDWGIFEPKGDARLLEEGLMAVGRHATETDPARAVAAFERLLAVLPDCPSALHARCTWLPIALPGTGDLPGAVLRIEALLEGAPENQRPGMRMQIGDVHALRGDFASAQREYAAALALLPAELEKHDLRGQAKSGLELRIATIGKPGPEIDAKTWLGGEAKPLTSYRGKVVVLDFWATWCGPCLRGIPGMSAIHRERGAHGVAVLGVTTCYKNGFLPSGADQLPWNFKDGETLPLVDVAGEVDEAANLDLLRRFRERVEMPYPSVVASRDDFQAWHVSGIPTVYVLGRDGRVGFVAVGSARDALIRAAVARLEAEPWAAPPPGEGSGG